MKTYQKSQTELGSGSHSSFRIAKRYAAFTLVELLVTITIVIVLAALAFTASSRAISRAKESDAMHDLRTIQAATVLYTTDNNGELFSVFDNGGSNGGWQNLWVDKLTDSLPHQGKTNGSTTRNSAFHNNKIKLANRWVADYAPNDNIIFSKDVNANPPRSNLKISRIERPSQEVMFVEGANNSPTEKLPKNSGAFTIWALQVAQGNFNYPNTIARRHGGDKDPAFYVVYCDGHTERINFNEFSKNRLLRKTMFSANDNGHSIYNQ